MSKPKKTKKKPEVVGNRACPRCKHVSGDSAVKIGRSLSARCHIVIDGKAYGTVVSQRTVCEQCGQVYFVKTYHEE
ncbi:MAG: hypothetical protein FWE95_06215 [Planctomycetaceae bacterium]|nr:hypothetical protein [Planctomycetaceae bacterium]